MTPSPTRESVRAAEAPFVLPKPPRERTGLVIRSERPGTAFLRRQALGLPALGARMAALLGCQERFLGELRTALADAAQGDGAALATAQQVLQWCDAVQEDLLQEARRANAGQQAVDLLEICHDVQLELGNGTAQQPLHVHGYARHTAWGSAAEVGNLLQLAIELVALRTGGQGGIYVEVTEDERAPRVRVRGSAGPCADPPDENIDEFRAAAAATGFLVLPDELGPGAAGLQILVPPHLRGPLAEYC